jgi:HEAT repeat protein
MQAIGTANVFPLLTQRLSDLDLDVRCAAIEALGLVDARHAVELLVPLLSDQEEVVRICACEALSTPEAAAATESLIVVLRDDTDPQVRNYAARALGHIGRRAAIPALLRAMDTDQEPDMHGHTPSHCAAAALDDMLGTNCTRIRLPSGTCTMRPGPDDIDGLRNQAMQAYEEWASG